MHGPTAPYRDRPPRPPWARRHPRLAAAALVTAAILGVVGVAAIGSALDDRPPSAAGASSTETDPSSTPTPRRTPSPSPTPSSSPEPTETEPGSPTDAPPATALAAVALLEVKGRAPRTGYDRDLFGSGWTDTDRNGCDTRNDVLARDLTDVEYKPGTHDCVVLSGTLADPFSGMTIAFQRGQGTSELVQIDHVVALADAWQKGAQQWDGPTRVAFRNDPLNLLAVDGALNQQKGDGDAATWLPPNKPFRCAYVARQVAVKVAYGLWVTAAERDAMVRVLSACPDEPLPTSSAAARPPTPTAATPTPTPTPAAPPPPPTPVPLVPPVDPAAGCDPSYPGVCIPPAPPDLDCGDIAPRRFAVLPPDPHRFDGDLDGIGCEG